MVSTFSQQYFQTAQEILKNCRAGDAKHARRVAKWVETLVPEHPQLELLIKAAYLHDFGWYQITDGSKLTKQELKKLEPQANAQSKKIITQFLEKNNETPENIQQILQLVAAADSHQANNELEAILVDADNLSKLTIDHLQEKYQPSNWQKMVELWKKTFPQRITTRAGIKAYPPLLIELELQTNNHLERKVFSLPTSHNQKLQCFSLRDTQFTGKRTAVIVMHGWESSTQRYTERARGLIELGYVCFFFDMRGHGKTGYDLKTFSREDHFNDCLRVYDYVAQKKNVDSKNISILGHSYGGYMAVLLSEQRTVANMALVAPAQYPDKGFTEPKWMQSVEQRMAYRKQPHSPKDNKALAIASKYPGEVLLLEAENDTVIFQQVIADYRSAFGTHCAHTVIPEADHAFYEKNTNQLAIEAVTNWFAMNSFKDVS